MEKGTRLVMEEERGRYDYLYKSKETSSFSVVCEGVTTHVFCLTSKTILWKP